MAKDLLRRRTAEKGSTTQPAPEFEAPPALGRRPPTPQRPQRVHRQHPGLQLVVLMGAEVVAIVGLTRLGGVGRWYVDWAHLWTWLSAAPLGDALAGLLRWAMLVLAWWLLATSVLYSLARLSKVPALIRGTGWLTIPFVRSAVDRAVVVTLAASTIIGARSGAAVAQTSAPTAGRSVAAASPASTWSGGTVSSAQASAALPAVERIAYRSEAPPPPAPDTRPSLAPPGQCVVSAGDNLWSIATSHLAEVTGRDVASLTPAEVTTYWWGVVDANRATLRSGIPSVIYAGETVVLPAVVAAPGGFSPGSVVSATAAAVPGAEPERPAPPAPAPVPSPPPAAPGPSVATPPIAAPVTQAPVTQAPVTQAPVTEAPVTTTAPAATASHPALPAVSPTAPTRRAAGSHSGVPVSKAAAAGVGLSGLLGGIYVWRMRREALAAHRRRRRGREPVQPDPETEPVERRVRAIADVETVLWVDATLRYASAALIEAGGGGVEGILCIRPGQLGMEVVVDPPRPPVGRFGSVDGGRTWALDPDLDLDELNTLALGQVLVPALCSVGTSADGPVLVDLEEAGVLAVEGDAARVEAFLAGAALELASAPWTKDTALYLLGGDEHLAQRELVEVVDAVAFAAGVDGLTTLVQDGDLEGATSTVAARVAPENVEGWFPTVVVAHPGTDADALAQLVARAGPRCSGLAVVAPGPLAGASWRLVVGADGLAVLEPLGIELDSRVDAEVVAALAGRLGARCDREDMAPVVEIAPAVETAAVVEMPPALNSIRKGPPANLDELLGELEGEPMEGEVRVLGPIEVDWTLRDGNLTPERDSQLSAVVAYLGTHDRPVPGPVLQEAIWPLSDFVDADADVSAGAAKDGTLRSAISRARKALGKDSLDRYHLLAAKRGAYGLGPRFKCDWMRFRRLVAFAEDASSVEAMEALRRALSLVRGRPFQDPPPVNFYWADDSPLVSEMEKKVVKAAEQLGELALEAGDPELAAWAAGQGLLAVPLREDLRRVTMRAAYAAGDVDGIDQAHTDAKRAARLIGEQLQDETERLYQRLKRSCRGADGDGHERDRADERFVAAARGRQDLPGGLPTAAAPSGEPVAAVGHREYAPTAPEEPAAAYGGTGAE